MNTTRKEVRAQFKEIGYKVSFIRNPFKDSLCNIAFKNDTMLKPCEVNSSNVYSEDFYTKHNKAFVLANSLKHSILTDTDQKII